VLDVWLFVNGGSPEDDLALGRAREIARALPWLRFGIERVGPDGPRAPPPLFSQNVERFREVAFDTARPRRLPAGPLGARICHALAGGACALAAAAAAREAGAALVLAAREAARGAAPAPPWEEAAAVVANCEAARRRAVEAGASERRVFVIPEGVDADRLAIFREERTSPEERGRALVALVAPIAPSSDVKTFLRAAKLLFERLDLVEVAVIGREEDERYARECQALAQLLAIDRLVRLVGPLRPEDYLRHIDCLVWSGEEGPEPRVLLEALAAGIPCVSTDAGAAREVIEGAGEEDRAIGPAGVLSPPGDYRALAFGIASIFDDPAARRRLAAAAEARIERFYRRERGAAAIGTLYRGLLESPASREPAAGPSGQPLRSLVE
jgi:glycosyltransferase involved in cell wall biosynthesis